MIKINLAQRAQAAYSGTKAEGGTASLLSRFKLGGGGGGGSSSAAGSLGNVLAFRKLILGGVILFLASTFVDEYQDMELKTVDDQIASHQEQGKQLQAFVNKTKAFDQLKKSMEQDSMVMSTKIQTIQKLIEDRAVPPRMMLSFITATPPGVWLQELKVGKSEISFRGSGAEFNQVSDFMRSLGEVAYISNVTLKNTQQVKDASGNTVASFELSANRK